MEHALYTIGVPMYTAINASFGLHYGDKVTMYSKF